MPEQKAHGRVRGRRWTAEDVRALGVRTDVPTAGAVLGMSSRSAYELARRGEFPVPALKLGGRYVVPTAPLLALLGLDGDGSERSMASRVPPEAA